MTNDEREAFPHRYRPLLRPAAFGGIPKSLGEWVYVEMPPDIAHMRPDVPPSRHRHGVVAFRRPLTDDERRRFDLEPA